MVDRLFSDPICLQVSIDGAWLGRFGSRRPVHLKAACYDLLKEESLGLKGGREQ